VASAAVAAAVPALFVEPCVRAVEYSLAHFLHDQATFFAERLAAEQPSDDALHLLASSYIHSGDPGRAYVVLQERLCSLEPRQQLQPRLRYLLALCCFKLEKFEEVEQALLGTSGNIREALADMPGGGAGFFLLGQVKEKLQPRQAIECYSKCLELCPFMWCAYERLSWLTCSTPVSSSRAFAGAQFSDEKFTRSAVLYPTGPPESAGAALSGAQLGATSAQNGPSSTEASMTTAVRKRRRNDGGAPAKQQNGEGSLVGSSPTAALTPAAVTPGAARVPLADRSSLPAPTQLPGSAAPTPPPSPVAGASSAPAPLFQTPVDLLSRLSPRWLLASPRRSPSRHTARNGQLAARTPLTGRRLPPRSLSQPASALEADMDTPPPGQPAADGCMRSDGGGAADAAEVAGAVQKEVRLSLAGLLRVLGEAVRSHHTYESSHTLEALSVLPTWHYETSFVQDLVARSHFEMANYRKAAEVFARCCEVHRYHRGISLEYYSTALWHLREAVQLSCLAQRLLAWDRKRPQAWLVVGNCFSLQQDHDQAIRCFRRAVQLDPSFTYAYTLIAHEYVASEKFDKATEMYERALAVDSRHYNAWWGLGNVYYRQEDYPKAKWHFEKAMEINGGNSVLRTFMGQACLSLGETNRALEMFTMAAQNPQCSALAFYQKGCVLTSIGRHAEAVMELQHAQSLAPREPCVHFELGRAYTGSGASQKALLHFTMAMDLCGAKDSKDHQIIVAAQGELLRATQTDEREVDEPSMSAPETPGSSGQRGRNRIRLL